MEGIEVKRVSLGDKENSDKVFEIRKKVFVEEQGVDASLEYDREEEAHHYLLFLGEKPIGAARWRETEKGIKLERFAILQPFRNRGLGAIILEEILADTIPSGKRIYLHSQLKAVPFYERHGFVASGAVFYEAEMGHRYMELRITNYERRIEGD
jgi:predicted GNAT family N-acyltransferase